MFPPRLAIGLAVSLSRAALHDAQGETHALPEQLSALNLGADPPRRIVGER